MNRKKHKPAPVDNNKLPNLYYYSEENPADIESPPDIDPRLGNLTPIYIEWFGETRSTDQFIEEYVKVRGRVPSHLQKYFGRI